MVGERTGADAPPVTAGRGSGPGRRQVVAGGAALLLGGCAGGLGGGSGGAGTGTAVIGLRIADSPGLRAARAAYLQLFPSLFGSDPPRARLTLGQVDPSTGGVDLPWFAALHNVQAQVAAEGYATAFEAARLVAGSYVTMNARLYEKPSARYQIVRVLEFSGGSDRGAERAELNGYRFDIAAGETVYVGTMVLSIRQLPSGKFEHALPQVVDEFDKAAIAHPVLRALGPARATRLMTLFSNTRPDLIPRAPQSGPPQSGPPLPGPQQPRPPVPAPPRQWPDAPPPTVPSPSGPPNVPRVG